MSSQPVVFLMGPTASGKSDLAMAWAEKYPIEIISVDSAMIYRGMDIGTAKPSVLERQQVPHHLIDICDPAESYSVGRFCQAAQILIPEILARDRIPVLVGGTMLYHRALLYGLSELPAADPMVRASIIQEAEVSGWSILHQKLKHIDPVSYQKITENDTQRIQRALEVYQLTGRAISSYWQQNKRVFKWSAKLCVISPKERHVLHQRIAERFKQMLALGFVEEVAALYHRRDLQIDLPAMRCVGYRQVWQMLSGELTHDQMREKGVAATRQLAKRQLTWLRHWPEEVAWFDSDQLDLDLNELMRI